MAGVSIKFKHKHIHGFIEGTQRLSYKMLSYRRETALQGAL